MKQAIVRKGMVETQDIPAPVVSDGSVLIRVVSSCISAGTEMAGVASSGTPLIQRIVKQPEKVAKILKMARSEGIKKIYKEVMGEIEAGKPVGYSVSGVVIATGSGVKKFKAGDRVAAAGGGLAYHAEYVSVPENLVVKIPGDLSFREASTVTLGSIALHGVRRADLELGEYGVVYGTGIMGLIAVQLLNASGIRVMAVDIDEKRLELAEKFGAERIIHAGKEDPVKAVMNHTGGCGADAVLFTAATTSSEPLSHSFNMCRRKGRVVLVGTAGMEIDRGDIYPGEIDLIISTSYGPGRYDSSYEEKGIDYPYAYVRWTENRNLGEYLRLIHQGKVDVRSMIEKEYPIDRAREAFESLGGSQRLLMVLLDYGETVPSLFGGQTEHRRAVQTGSFTVNSKVVNVALIGAGNFARKMHIPLLEGMADQFRLHAVADRSGTDARTVAEQHRATFATTDPGEVFKDPKTDLVLICTRHDSHGSLVLQALEAGKHVFVEKPLTVYPGELDRIRAYYEQEEPGEKPLLMVGFNRRFSPYAGEIRRKLERRVGPAFIQYSMNAGYIPADHWVHENGGRIVGEACHIIDLFQYLVGDRIVSACYESLDPRSGRYLGSDNKAMVFRFGDGSVATLGYFSLGNSTYPKEQMQVHFDEKTITLDDYRSMKARGIQMKELSTPRPSKGHREEWNSLYRSLTETGSQWPIPLQDLLDTTGITFMIT